MGQTGSCENLRFPAVFCENLRCTSQEKRKSAKINGDLRKTANLAPFVPFSLSLLIPPRKKRGAPTCQHKPEVLKIELATFAEFHYHGFAQERSSSFDDTKTPTLWAREMGTICLLAPQFYSTFGPNLGAIHVARPVVVL